MSLALVASGIFSRAVEGPWESNHESDFTSGDEGVVSNFDESGDEGEIEGEEDEGDDDDDEEEGEEGEEQE